jgi:hypothetical protein
MTTMSSQQRWPVERRQNQTVSLNKQWNHKGWLDLWRLGVCSGQDHVQCLTVDAVKTKKGLHQRGKRHRSEGVMEQGSLDLGIIGESGVDHIWLWWWGREIVQFANISNEFCALSLSLIIIPEEKLVPVSPDFLDSLW